MRPDANEPLYPEALRGASGACWLKGSKDGDEDDVTLLSVNSMSRRLSEAAGAGGARGAAAAAGTACGVAAFASWRAGGAGAAWEAAARVGEDDAGYDGALDSPKLSRATLSTMLAPNSGIGRASSIKSNHTAQS